MISRKIALGLLFGLCALLIGLSPNITPLSVHSRLARFESNGAGKDYVDITMHKPIDVIIAPTTSELNQELFTDQLLEGARKLGGVPTTSILSSQTAVFRPRSVHRDEDEPGSILSINESPFDSIDPNGQGKGWGWLAEDVAAGKSRAMEHNAADDWDFRANAFPEDPFDTINRQTRPKYESYGYEDDYFTLSP